MLDLMGVEYTILSDASDQFDTPSDGEFRMYDGGTTLEDDEGGAQRQGDAVAAGLLHAERRWTTPRRFGQETARLHYPLGVGATDELLHEDLGAHRQGDPEAIARSAAA